MRVVVDREGDTEVDPQGETKSGLQAMLPVLPPRALQMVDNVNEMGMSEDSTDQHTHLVRR